MSMVLMAASIVVGGIDLATPLPPEAWFLALVWLVVFGMAAGAGAFSSDLKNNYIRFLEYLPVRRWHMWFANWLDGLIWLGAMVLALTWGRTLHWHDPSTAALSE